MSGVPVMKCQAGAGPRATGAGSADSSPRSQGLSAQGATLARSDTCTAARGSSATKLPAPPRDSSQPSDASSS